VIPLTLQISYLETLVTSVELAHHQIISKNTYRCQSIFVGLLQRICFKQTDRKTGSGAAEDFSGRQAGASTHSDNGLVTISPINSGMNGRKGVLNGTNSAGGIGLTAITAVAGAHQQAETLKLELERVKSGLTLLAQSMEKLQETVRVDSRCCGGISDICASMESSVARSTTSGFRVGMSGRRPTGYDRVDGLLGDDEDHTGGGDVSNPATVISPLGYGNPLNTRGSKSTIGGRGNGSIVSASGNAKFTIESDDTEDN
jgi:hypothetical protein